ncbi:MAG: PPC domain-containing DNA-binding protein [Bacteroidota bacterium]
MKTHTFRLEPEEDLRQSLEQFLAQRKIDAAAMVTCVGSLSQVALRLAGAAGPTFREGDFEIVSLVGTLSRHGVHLHLAVADARGAMFGGHLVEGCSVRTTAEIVLLELPGTTFRRVLDASTGYRELRVDYKNSGA